MSHSVRRLVLLGTSLALLLAEETWAWGNEGHKIVCQIAYNLLSVNEQKEIDDLVELYRPPDGNGQSYDDFVEACTFADRARSNADDGVQGWSFFSRFSRWHFLNVPRDTRDISENHCGGDCILEGIEFHSARLADSGLKRWKRAEALIFLGHWIGDIHQPLHISYADDWGGNKIKPIKGGYYLERDLHYVWDTGIISRAMGAGWQGYAAHLQDEIAEIAKDDPDVLDQWRSSLPLEWAQESYMRTTTKEVDYCEWTANDEGEVCRPEGHIRYLDAAYQKQFQKTVEMRLMQAGVRLAAVIQQAFSL